MGAAYPIIGGPELNPVVFADVADRSAAGAAKARRAAGGKYEVCGRPTSDVALVFGTSIANVGSGMGAKAGLVVAFFDLGSGVGAGNSFSKVAGDLINVSTT